LLILAIGELFLVEVDEEDFKADFAGETERAGGLCLISFAKSTATGAKCAARGGLSDCVRSPRKLPLPFGGLDFGASNSDAARRGKGLS